MRKKRICVLALSVCMLASISAFAACKSDKDNPPQSNSSVEEVEFGFAESYYTVAEEGQIALALKGVEEGKTVTWSSDDPSIATVNESGIVTGVKSGNTLIRATVDDVYVICSITVTPYAPIEVLNLTLNANNVTLYIGDGYQLQANLWLGSNAVTAESVVYESKNANVLTVENGKITAIGAGEASVAVTATYEGKSVVKTIAVSVLEPAIVFAPDFSIREMKKGEELPLAVKVMKGKEDVSLDNIDVEWTLEGNNGNVQMANGKLTALKKGNVTLAASCEVEGNSYMFSIPMRIREEYSVKFIAEGNTLSEQTVLDGELAELPNSPVLKDRIFGGWFVENNVFDETVGIEQDAIVKAHWFMDGKGYVEASQSVVFHNYSSISEFDTNITWCNDQFPDGEARLQPQDKKGDYYITLPVIDFAANGFARCDEVSFTFNYNYDGLAVKLNNQELVTTTPTETYLIRVVKTNNGSEVYLGENKVLALKDGEKLTFSFNIDAANNPYAEFAIGPMCYWRVDYRAYAEQLLAKIPDTITDANYQAYLGILAEYEQMIGCYTEYEKSVYVEPSKITALKNFIN